MINKQKEMLLEQIEQQKRQKEQEKQRIRQEEIEEEERIKREIEIMNAREKGEIDEKRNRQQQYRKALDEEAELRNASRQNNRNRASKPPTPSRPQINNDVPPEFRDLANQVEKEHQK